MSLGVQKITPCSSYAPFLDLVEVAVAHDLETDPVPGIHFIPLDQADPGEGRLAEIDPGGRLVGLQLVDLVYQEGPFRFAVDLEVDVPPGTAPPEQQQGEQQAGEKDGNGE